MVKPKGKIWEYYLQQTDKSVVCKFCSKKYKFSNAIKMKNHIYKNCIECPNEVKMKFETKDKSTDSERVVTSTQSLIQLSTHPTITKPSGSRPKQTQNIMGDKVSEENNTINMALSKAIFFSGSSVELDHPLWIDFFKLLKPTYSPPTKKSISSIYLEKHFNEMKTKIEIDIKNSTELNLKCDGWTNLENGNDHSINFVITKPEPVFIDCINTNCSRDIPEYLAEKIQDIIIKFGGENFFSLIGDNTLNMQTAFKILNAIFPKLITSGCFIHSLHLLWEDILKCNLVDEFLTKVVDIVKRITNQNDLNTLYNEINAEKHCSNTLALPDTKQLDCLLECFRLLQKSKDTLQMLATKKEAELTLGKNMKEDLLDNTIFWTSIDNMIDLLSPIMKWIHFFQSNEFLIHHIAGAHKEIEFKIKILLSSCHLNKIDQTKILELYEKRKENSLQPIHFAAALLDPPNQGKKLSHEEQINAIEFIHKISENMNLNVHEIMYDLGNYRSKNELWSNEFLWISAKSITPVVWWRGFCASSILSKVAVRILSSPTTSTTIERSSFNNNDKNSSRLTTERINKIKYLSFNFNLNKTQSEKHVQRMDPLNVNLYTDSIENSETDEEINYRNEHNNLMKSEFF